MTTTGGEPTDAAEMAMGTGRLTAVRVDSHQHYWRPERGDYSWLQAAPALLRRRFGPADLMPLLDETGVDATVLVQAAPSVAETDYLLGIADATPTVAGVVGWIDFERPDQRTVLDRLADHPRLVSIRPMVQDIADDDWVLRGDLEWAFAALAERALCFDALGYPRHAARFLKLCERYPDLPIVLDHGLKPEIARDRFEPWSIALADLASQTHAFCKLSGLATEAGGDPSANRLRPYIDRLLELFGPKRLMWGSDWPVVTSALDYRTWIRLCESALGGLSREDRAAIFGGNAARFYRLQV